ncbi:TetR/AcrR family transcriptional regulator [Streptomyces sp. NPDC002758]
MTDSAANSPVPPGRRSAGSPREVSRKPGDERWKELLDVAAQMFAEQGYAATSLQQLANQLGIFKGSLYYYISSKEDLLYEVIKAVYVSGVANFQAMAGGEGDAVERLRRAIEGHVVHLIENLTATTVYLHEFDRLSKDRQDELSRLDYVHLVRDLIVTGQTEGGIRADLDPTLATMAVLGATNWIYRWYHPGSRAPREIGQEFARIIVDGMRAN